MKAEKTNPFFPLAFFLIGISMFFLLPYKPVMGQEEAFVQPKPVMENIFYNVLLGSVSGLLLSASFAALEAEDPSSPKDFTETVFTGATAGGIIGLVAGFYFVLSGSTFKSAGLPVESFLNRQGLNQGVNLQMRPLFSPGKKGFSGIELGYRF